MRSMVKLDLIGHEPKFYVKQKERYQTSLGGLLYVIIFFIGVAGFINFGKELWERVNPDVNLSQDFDTIPENFTIDFENFNVIIGVQNPANSITYINSGIYSLISTFHEMYNNGTIKITPLPVIQCTYEIFGNNDLIKNANIKNTWCLDKEKIKNLTLAGTFGNTYWSSLRFHVIPCRNNTNNNTCLPQDEIDKYLKGSYFSVRYINYLINTKNFTNPYFKMIDNDFFVMSNSYYKELNIYFSNIDILSDTGFLFENFENKRIVQLRNLKEQIDLRTNSNDMMRAIIRLSTVRNIYNRKYVKIQRLMADIGGLLKTLLMIAQFVYMFYNTNVFFEYVINSGSSNEDSDSRIISTIKLNDYDPSTLKRNPPTKFTVHPIKLPSAKIPQERQLSIRLKWYEALLCLVTKEFEHRKKFERAVSTIKEKMSIETYLKLISDFDRISNNMAKNIT